MAALATLCSICYNSPPKYKCPRCRVRTCSLACVRKHKSWSDCTGERDATAFVSRKRLRTAAGIDHDYNFLHKIERAVERTEKTIVDEKHLVAAGELRTAREGDKVTWKWQVGRDGRKRKIPVLKKRFRRPENGRLPIERALAAALRKDNVEVVRAPQGMQREKENKTNWSRRSNRVNWQVEWLVISFPSSPRDATEKRRLLAKVMEDTPLWKAYASTLEEEQMSRLSKNEKRRKRQEKQLLRWAQEEGEAQQLSGKWTTGDPALQDAETTRWSVDAGKAAAALEAGPDTNQYRFFLARASQQAGQPTVVTALDATQTLKATLADTKVLEFPSLYVLPGGSEERLPPGFELGAKEPASARLDWALAHEGDGESGKKRKHDETGGGKDADELGNGADELEEDADELEKDGELELEEVSEYDEDETSSDGSDASDASETSDGDSDEGELIDLI